MPLYPVPSDKVAFQAILSCNGEKTKQTQTQTNKKTRLLLLYNSYLEQIHKSQHETIDNH